MWRKTHSYSFDFGICHSIYINTFLPSSLFYFILSIFYLFGRCDAKRKKKKHIRKRDLAFSLFWSLSGLFSVCDWSYFPAYRLGVGQLSGKRLSFSFLPSQFTLLSSFFFPFSFLLPFLIFLLFRYIFFKNSFFLIPNASQQLYLKHISLWSCHNIKVPWRFGKHTFFSTHYRESYFTFVYS